MQSAHVELAIRYWSQFQNFSYFYDHSDQSPPNLQIGVDSGTCFNCIFSGSAQFSIYHTNFAVQIYRIENSILPKTNRAGSVSRTTTFSSTSQTTPNFVGIRYRTRMPFCIRHGPPFSIWHQNQNDPLMQLGLLDPALYMTGRFTHCLDFANIWKNHNEAESNISFLQL